DLEAGYPQTNGDSARAPTTLPNLGGDGISFTTALTFPLHWVPPIIYLLHTDAKFESIDTTLRVPRWILRRVRVPADGEVQAFLRQQDTPRFGQLQTAG